jgi:ABC-2 type transport system ATP-binding protein
VGRPAIEVRQLSKDFLLPHLRRNTVKGYYLDLFRRRRIIELHHALQDLSFEVMEGEFFGVVGRNGSGKSTLLKILAGIYKPTSGEVTVRGRLVPFIELGVGFNAELSGRDNVYLNGALMGFSRAEMDEMYDDIVAFAELEGYMDQKLKNYSSGMQVRIAFSLATRARGDVLLVDEVLAVGDTAFQRKCFEHFRQLKSGSTTIVFVTHNMDAVREFCDRAILIEGSHILAAGSADEVAEKYTRLFTRAPREEQPADHERPPEARWGEGQVRYERIRVKPLLRAGEPLTIEVEAVALQSVDDAVFGFLVSTSSGLAILGTNSNLKKQRCGPMRKGERVHLVWEVPDLFAEGMHSVDVAVSDGWPCLSVYDYWQEAAWFTVEKEERTPYPITPHTTLTLAHGPLPVERRGARRGRG